MPTRKELKNSYKQEKRPMGVFQIRNLQSGKIFIGSTQDLTTILNSQKFRLEFGGHPNEQLQKDWNALGPENFAFEILHSILPSEDSTQDPRVEVKALETLCLSELQPYGERGYNRESLTRLG